jgi:hypothetical protein
MKHTEQTRDMTSEEAGKPSMKRPYVKPEVRHEPVFEVRALVCGKYQPTQMICQMNWKSS